MTMRPARLVLHALAVTLLLAPLGAAAQEPQRRERQSVPSPFSAFSNALRGVRERIQQGQQAAPADRAQTARPGARRQAARRRAPTPVVARLPKPRPSQGAAAELPSAWTALAGNAAPLAGIEPAAGLLGQWPEKPEWAPAGTVDMLTSFASAAADPRLATLPVPEEVVPQRAALEEPVEPPTVFPPLPAVPAPAAETDPAFPRIPRARPDPAAPSLVRGDPETGDEPAPAPAPKSSAAPPLPVALSPEESACLARLELLGVEFTRLDPISGPEGCEVAAPLEVSSLGSGVAIAPEAVLNCRTAEALALWVRNSMAPAAEALLKARPETIMHGSTYVCRPRNNQAGEKLSEHATANAVDIAAIGFSGRPPVNMEALSPALPEGKFAAAIRMEACAYFTTVLGPGSDAAHASHFHFDMAERRGGYRLCDLGEASTASAAAEGEETSLPASPRAVAGPDGETP